MFLMCIAVKMAIKIKWDYLFIIIEHTLYSLGCTHTHNACTRMHYTIGTQTHTLIHYAVTLQWHTHTDSDTHTHTHVL